MKSKLVLASALAFGIGLAGAPSHAGTQPIVAFPGSFQTSTFGVLDVESTKGTDVTFVNLDPLAAHNVKSVATDNVKRTWCTNAQALAGKCEKFYSGASIEALEQDIVDGVKALPVGTYAFYCEPHPNMEGVLRITA